MSYLKVVLKECRENNYNFKRHKYNIFNIINLWIEILLCYFFSCSYIYIYETNIYINIFMFTKII